jgi:hypothetical protein
MPTIITIEQALQRPLTTDASASSQASSKARWWKRSSQVYADKPSSGNATSTAPFFAACFARLDGFGGIESRIGNPATGHAYRHASEIMAVEIEESVFHLELVHTMPRIRGSCSGA